MNFDLGSMSVGRKSDDIGSAVACAVASDFQDFAPPYGRRRLAAGTTLKLKAARGLLPFLSIEPTIGSS